MVIVTVVEVEKIEVVSGATMIADGSATPQDVDICAAIKGIGDVILKAVINPNIPVADLPANFITWSGGQAVDGQPLQRMVSKANWVKETIDAKCNGTTKYTMLTYIIGATAHFI